MFSPLFFESVNNKDYFPLLIDSNSFATVNCDARLNTKAEYSINYASKFKTIPELNTLHHICEPERRYLLTKLAMSVQNPHIAGYLSTGNRSIDRCTEGCTTCFFISRQLLSPLCEADKRFDCILKYY